MTRIRTSIPYAIAILLFWIATARPVEKIAVTECKISSPIVISRCDVVCKANERMRNCEAFLGQFSDKQRFVVMFENRTGLGLKNLTLQIEIANKKIPEKPLLVALVGPSDRVIIELSPEGALAREFGKWKGEIVGLAQSPIGTVIYDVESAK